MRATHRHKKTGGHYHHIGTARIQSETPLNDMDAVEIYIGADGHIWARKSAEFFDDRFETLERQP